MLSARHLLSAFLTVVIIGLSSCGDSSKDNPAPTPVNVKATTRKPGSKPSIETNVKNEAAKSTKKTGGQSTKASIGGVKPNFSTPSSNTQVNKLASGNSTFGRTSAVSVSGWAINTVALYDESDSSAIILFTTDASLIDSDEDGEPDVDDTDDDNDGTPDNEDSDDDNDGVSDAADDEDDDNDGILDIDDLDDDGDGVTDDEEEETATASNTDSDDDGIFDDQDNDDDGDGIDDSADVDNDGDGIDDEDEDDFDELSDESLFDFSLFFFSTGEYMVYDPSENDDAWDWGYWYFGQEQSDNFLCMDLGDDDEEIYLIDDEVSDPAKLELATYDIDSGLFVIIAFDKLTLS